MLHFAAALQCPARIPETLDQFSTDLTPADFAKLISEETEKWGKVAQAANLKPD